jgi:V-type H+-transporting ATPase subunit a
MFGDAGHGLIMFCASLFLVLRERQLERLRIKDEIFQMIFGGRYVVLSMGCFAMYTGMVGWAGQVFVHHSYPLQIYNDVFSKSVNIFGSGWVLDDFNETVWRKWTNESEFVLDPATAFTGQVYPFGIDPIWGFAENNLAFLNSFKMKISIILGIGQMAFGVVLSYLNYRCGSPTGALMPTRNPVTFIKRPKSSTCSFRKCCFSSCCSCICALWW